MVVCRANKDVDEIMEPILKYFCVSFNLITFLVSCGYIVGGSWLLYYWNKTKVDDTNLSGVFDLELDLGVFLLIVGIVGIIFTSMAIAATYRENIFCLRIYLGVLIVFIIMNIVVGVIFLIFSGKITTTINESLGSNYITRYSEDNSIKAIYDTLQSQYSCCGIKDYKDWGYNPYYNCTTSSQAATKCMVPASCCVSYTNTINLYCSGNVLADKTKLVNIHQSGCSSVIINTAAYAINVMSAICISVTIFLAINVALIQWLIMLIHKEQALYNAKHKTSGSYLPLDEAFIG